EDVQPGDDLEDSAEDDDDEQRAGEVEGTHEDRHGADGGPAGAADDGAKGTEGADRAAQQDDHRDLEEAGVELADAVADRIASVRIAAQPGSPTTAAMAPKAPTGAAHMIIIMSLKTTAWMWRMPLTTGSPALPIDCSANPTRRASTRVGRTGMSPGMRLMRKSTVAFDSPPPDSW